MVRVKADDADETNACTERPREARKRLAIMMEGTDSFIESRACYLLEYRHKCRRQPHLLEIRVNWLTRHELDQSDRLAVMNLVFTTSRH
jgi:hypothetical protein